MKFKVLLTLAIVILNLLANWGLGIGDWGLGPIPNPQSPIPKYICYDIINYNYIIYLL